MTAKTGAEAIYVRHKSVPGKKVDAIMGSKMTGLSISY